MLSASVSSTAVSLSRLPFVNWLDGWFSVGPAIKVPSNFIVAPNRKRKSKLMMAFIKRFNFVFCLCRQKSLYRFHHEITLRDVFTIISIHLTLRWWQVADPNSRTVRSGIGKIMERQLVCPSRESSELFGYFPGTTRSWFNCQSANRYRSAPLINYSNHI